MSLLGNEAAPHTPGTPTNSSEILPSQEGAHEGNSAENHSVDGWNPFGVSQVQQARSVASIFESQDTRELQMRFAKVGYVFMYVCMYVCMYIGA